MPLLQTSAHHPEMSKQNDQSSSDRSSRILSTSPIQEHADSAKTSLSAMTQGTSADRSRKHATPPSHNQESTAIAALGIIITAMLTMTLVLQKQGLSSIDNPTLSKTAIDQAMMEPTQYTECPECGHWTLEGPLYKGPPRNATYSPPKLPDSLSMPSTPNNSPVTSPCLLHQTIPPLQRRSEDSGNKQRLTTTPGKATTSSIHGGATTTALIPGTVARQWVATKITLQTKMTTVTPGTPVQPWIAMKARVTPRTHHTPPIMMPTTKTTSNALGCTLPHPGTFPPNKNMMSLIMSSPTLSTNNSLTIPHSECLGNMSPSMTLHASASTCAWMVLHNDSLEKSKPLTSTTWTWRNFSMI